MNHFERVKCEIDTKLKTHLDLAAQALEEIREHQEECCENGFGCGFASSVQRLTLDRELRSLDIDMDIYMAQHPRELGDAMCLCGCIQPVELQICRVCGRHL